MARETFLDLPIDSAPLAVAVVLAAFFAGAAWLWAVEWLDWKLVARFPPSTATARRVWSRLGRAWSRARATGQR